MDKTIPLESLASALAASVEDNRVATCNAMLTSLLVNLLSGSLVDRDESIQNSARSLQGSWIQNATPDEDASATNSENSDPQEYNDGKVLRATFVVYGSVLLGVFVLFCYVRRKFPRPFNIRNWVEELKTPIAAQQHGFVSWMWQLNTVSEDEILEECGLDALCFLRVLRMGYNIAVVGCFNALWLMPLYATGETDATTAAITDRVVKVTIAHVPEGSPRCIGTVLAAYIFFGYIMFLILVEFEWFIDKRHKYLKKPRARNYSVYVRNIPDEYKSNSELEDYFRSCFSDKAILEARVRVKAPSLQSAVSKRDKLVSRLEHAINYEQVKGQAPQHRSSLVAGALVDSIPAYANALKEANDEVTKMIVEIEQAIERKSVRQTLENRAASNALSLNPLYRGSMYQFNRMEVPANDDSFDQPHLVPTEVEELESTSELNSLHISAITHDQSMECDVLATTETGSSPPNIKVGEQESNHSASRIMIGQGVQLVSSKTKLLAKKAVSLIPTTKNGEFYNAGFVTFTSLRTTSAALQMIHHDRPFSVEVLEAPRPEDIFWANVGRSHKDLQVGNLLSLSATAALCLLWTIPMTFIASLSSVEALAEEFQFVEDIIEAIPFIGIVLEVLAPLFVKIANAMLPVILTAFSRLEGPVSTSIVEASLFVKLAAFMIIQTFFVSAVTTGLMQELSNIIENPEEIFSLLAVSLPSRSTYFIQIVFVGTVVALSMELLRIKPLCFAFIRRFLPPNLTEKERQTTAFGVSPLSQPLDFEGADNLSQIVLNFIVMLVYAVIAPLTVFIQAFCFMLLFVSYRHQFVHIYSANPDSGGKIWTNFIKILMTCMLIAEFTIVGLMALKKAVVAFPLMIPLIVITVLFNAYVHQQHFRAAEFLPSRECLKEDLRNGTDLDLSFTRGAYLQEEMRDKKKFPENLNAQRAEALGLIDADDESLLSALVSHEVQQ